MPNRLSPRAILTVAGTLAIVVAILVWLAIRLAVGGPFVLAPVAAFFALVIVVAGVLLAVNSRMALREWTATESALLVPAATTVVSVNHLNMLYSGRDDDVIDEARAYLFIHALIRPQKVFVRISEKVEPTSRSVSVDTTFVASVRRVMTRRRRKDGSVVVMSSLEKIEPDGSNFLLPLIVVPRGVDTIGLRITDARGSRTSSLSQQWVATFGLACARVLVHRADPDVFEWYTREIERQLALALYDVAPTEINSSDRAERIDALIRRVHDRLSPKHAQRAADFEALVRALALLNPICVPVRAEDMSKLGIGDGVRFTVHRRVIPPVRDIPGWESSVTQRSLGQLRLMLNVRPLSSYFDLSNANRAASYHLEVAGPEGTYAARQELLTNASSVTGSYGVLAGQRRANVNLSSADTGFRGIFAVHFNARSAGALAGSFLTSLSCFFVIAVIYVRLDVFQGVDGGSRGPAPLPSLLPALLAVPVAVAALSGFVTHQTPSSASLLSRLYTLLAVALALGAFALVSLSGSFSGRWGTLWSFLLAVSIVLMMCNLVSWVLRVRIEHRLRDRIKRNDR